MVCQLVSLIYSLFPRSAHDLIQMSISPQLIMSDTLQEQSQQNTAQSVESHADHCLYLCQSWQKVMTMIAESNLNHSRKSNQS